MRFTSSGFSMGEGGGIDIMPILFVGLFVAFFVGIIFLMKSSGRVTSSAGEKKLFQELARKLNLTYCETDTIGLGNKVESKFAFGRKPVEPILNIATGKMNQKNVYFFIRQGWWTSGPPDYIKRVRVQHPKWSVCLLELDNSVNFELIIIPRNIMIGGFKTYNIFPSNIKEIDVTHPAFKKKAIVKSNDYAMFSDNQAECEKAIRDGMLDIFLKAKFTLQGFHIKDNLVAGFAHMGFDAIDQFENLFNFTDEMNTKLKEQVK